MTATASYVKARAEVRLTTALREYRRSRAWWFDPAARLAPVARQRMYLVEVLVARAVWSAYVELLSDPDWSSLRANGLDADDLALLTRDGAA